MESQSLHLSSSDSVSVKEETVGLSRVEDTDGRCTSLEPGMHSMSVKEVAQLVSQGQPVSLVMVEDGEEALDWIQDSVMLESQRTHQDQDRVIIVQTHSQPQSSQPSYTTPVSSQAAGLLPSYTTPVSSQHGTGQEGRKRSPSDALPGQPLSKVIKLSSDRRGVQVSQGLVSDHESLVLKTGSLASDHGSLVVKTGSLAADHGSLVVKTGSLASDHGSLVVKTGSLATDHGSLVVKTGSLAADHGSLVVTTVPNNTVELSEAGQPTVAPKTEPDGWSQLETCADSSLEYQAPSDVPEAMLSPARFELEIVSDVCGLAVASSASSLSAESSLSLTGACSPAQAVSVLEQSRSASRGSHQIPRTETESNTISLTGVMIPADNDKDVHVARTLSSSATSTVKRTSVHVQEAKASKEAAMVGGVSLSTGLAEAVVYQCGECDYASTNKHYYKQHVDLVHNTARPFKCPFCDYAGKRGHALREHLVVHSAQRPYSCMHCNATFRKKGHLTNHTKLHAGSAGLPGGVAEGLGAGKVVKMAGSTEAGESVITVTAEPSGYLTTVVQPSSKAAGGAVRRSRSELWCALCDKDMDTAPLFQNHLQTVHGTDRLYACDRCPYVAVDKAAILNHLPVHITSTPTPHTITPPPASSSPAPSMVYGCSECGFSTTSMATLTLHAASHTAGTLTKGSTPRPQALAQMSKVMCSECGHVANSKEAMASHMWTHIDAHDTTAELKDKQPHHLSHDQTGETTAGEERSNCGRVELKTLPENAAFKCTECSFVSRDATHFVKHMLVHKTRQNQAPKAQTSAAPSPLSAAANPTSTTATTATKTGFSFQVRPITTENTCHNMESSPFVHDTATGRFRCTICGYSCEYQRTIKAHIWKHSGHRQVDYPIFQNGPLSMYEESAGCEAVGDQRKTSVVPGPTTTTTLSTQSTHTTLATHTTHTTLTLPTSCTINPTTQTPMTLPGTPSRASTPLHITLLSGDKPAPATPKPATVAIGNKPAPFTPGDKPATVAIGYKPSTVAIGNKPALVTIDNKPVPAGASSCETASVNHTSAVTTTTASSTGCMPVSCVPVSVSIFPTSSTTPASSVPNKTVPLGIKLVPNTDMAALGSPSTSSSLPLHVKIIPVTSSTSSCVTAGTLKFHPACSSGVPQTVKLTPACSSGVKVTPASSSVTACTLKLTPSCSSGVPQTVKLTPTCSSGAPQTFKLTPNCSSVAACTLKLTPACSTSVDASVKYITVSGSQVLSSSGSVRLVPMSASKPCSSVQEANKPCGSVQEASKLCGSVQGANKHVSVDVHTSQASQQSDSEDVSATLTRLQSPCPEENLNIDTGLTPSQFDGQITELTVASPDIAGDCLGGVGVKQAISGQPMSQLHGVSEHSFSETCGRDKVPDSTDATSMICDVHTEISQNNSTPTSLKRPCSTSPNDTNTSLTPPYSTSLNHHDDGTRTSVRPGETKACCEEEALSLVTPSDKVTSPTHAGDSVRLTSTSQVSMPDSSLPVSMPDTSPRVTGPVSSLQVCMPASASIASKEDSTRLTSSLPVSMPVSRSQVSMPASKTDSQPYSSPHTASVIAHSTLDMLTTPEADSQPCDSHRSSTTPAPQDQPETEAAAVPASFDFETSSSNRLPERVPAAVEGSVDLEASSSATDLEMCCRETPLSTAENDTDKQAGRSEGSGNRTGVLQTDNSDVQVDRAQPEIHHPHCSVPPQGKNFIVSPLDKASIVLPLDKDSVNPPLDTAGSKGQNVTAAREESLDMDTAREDQREKDLTMDKEQDVAMTGDEVQDMDVAVEEQDMDVAMEEEEDGEEEGVSRGVQEKGVRKGDQSVVVESVHSLAAPHSLTGLISQQTSPRISRSNNPSPDPPSDPEVKASERQSEVKVSGGQGSQRVLRSSRLRANARKKAEALARSSQNKPSIRSSFNKKAAKSGQGTPSTGSSSKKKGEALARPSQGTSSTRSSSRKGRGAGSKTSSRTGSKQDSESAVTLLSLLRRGARPAACTDSEETEGGSLDSSPTQSGATTRHPSTEGLQDDVEPSASGKTRGAGGGICSTLLAVIEQLRERSRSESEAEEPLPRACGKKRAVRGRGQQDSAEDAWEAGTTDNIERLGEEDSVTYRCKLCHYTNPRLPLIRLHMRTHRQKDPFECSLCPMVAESSEALQEHMIQHCKVRTYSCKFCPQSFNHKSTLRAHMRAHNDADPFLCDLCDFECSSPLDYRAHMQTHAGSSELTCPDCPTVVSSSSELRQHRTLACPAFVHTTDAGTPDPTAVRERFSLELNDITETYSSHLHQSSPLVGGASVEVELAGEGPLRCALCDFTAVSSRSLKSHMKRHANDQRYVQQPLEQYKCALCGYVCHHLPSLKSHLWRHASDHNYSYQFTNDVINAAIDYDTRSDPSPQQKRSEAADEPELLDRMLCAERRIVEGQMSVGRGSQPVCWVTFRCCQCGFETINKAKLNLHMRTHADVIQRALKVQPSSSENASHSGDCLPANTAKVVYGPV